MPGKKVSGHMAALRQALAGAEQITTQQAMELLGVSESTVRRLFARLAQQGDIVRTFGGICRPAAADAYSYDQLAEQAQEAKGQIARQAVALVQEGDVLYLDGGTTNAVMAAALAARLRGGQLCEVRVFTNSLSTLSALAGACPVHLIGGRYRPNRRDFCGYMAEEDVARLRFTRCFLGADGCDAERGFTTTDFETARLCGLVLAASGESYVLADSGKFGRVSLVPYAQTGQVGAVITDAGVSAAARAGFAAAGGRLLAP